MKRHWRKGAIAFVALVMVAFMASSAMAIILTGRSEEMTANSTCDLAGTIDLKFNETDYNLISSYLSANNTPLLNAAAGPLRTNEGANFVLIRATLGGENIDIATAEEPRLCRDIVGEGSGAVTLGAAGDPLPNERDLVVLDVLDIEVSDISDNTAGLGVVAPDGIPDVTAYVHGRTGQQFLSIYVTDLAVATNWNDERTWPWIKVGLFQRVTDVDSDPATNPELGDGFPTSICVNVVSFGTLAILDVSLDIEPTQLTYTTSDNQIGHFLRQNIELRDCEKGESCEVPDTEVIELCDIGEQENCATYYKCIVAEGTYPSSGRLNFTIRTNGATNGANTQEGVYLYNVALFNANGSTIGNPFTFYEADGTTVVEDIFCTFEAEQATTELEAGELDGDIIQICVFYQVNPDDVTRDAEGEILNPTVQFWINIASVPCGDLLEDVYNGATLAECGQGESCMYFPYVLYDAAAIGAWSTGIAITNLSEFVPVEDMEATISLTDSEGTVFTGMMPRGSFTSKVSTMNIDALIANMGWEPVGNTGWIQVVGNFPIDGYCFIFSGDASFGAGTLPRVLDNCNLRDFQ